ncbi:MAG: amidohydrolase [Clostridia bacterium]|nr:amidohydrolase [Clostridia bacterium]
MGISNEMLAAKVEEIAEHVIHMRRALHRIPELAFCEEKTAAYIAEQLDKIGIPYQKGVAKTGVVALIEAKNAEKTLLIRADMDALPMDEKKDCEFSSIHAGRMHACGHDAHTAVLLGAAEILWQLKEHLSCNVKLLFQPAEEGVGGALPMIEEGVMENPTVTAALALHVMNDAKVGTVALKPDGIMACPDEFDLKVIGKGGHAAYPELCINPISVVSEIVLAFSELANKLNRPERPVVISVCGVQAGTTAHNIIPETAQILGTVRLYDKTIRAEIPGLLEEIIREKAEKYGARYEWDYRLMYPPLINDEAMTKEVSRLLSEILGEEQVGVCKASMGGEDFAYFTERVPGVYFNLGTGNAEKGIDMPLHSPDFKIDEDALKIGVLAFCKVALEYK